jgi:hypothetical protein
MLKRFGVSKASITELHNLALELTSRSIFSTGSLLVAVRQICTRTASLPSEDVAT